MGFYPQPNDWTCGPFALKHALVALGQMVDEDEIARKAKTHWWSGTDDLRLASAARAYDCDLRLVRKRAGDDARKHLIATLRRHVPAILCVDEWGHWVTVLRHQQGQFVLVDSNLDPVLDITAWPQLRRRWAYHDTDYDEDDPPVLYDFFAVEPRFRVATRAALSVSRVRHLRRPENRDLAQHLDEYLEDLLDICRPRDKRMTRPLSMGEFLRRHQELIVSRTMFWHGDVDRKTITKLLRNLQFVADTYGLVVPGASSRRALADLSILTTLWVATLRGVGEMYGAGG